MIVLFMIALFIIWYFGYKIIMNLPTKEEVIEVTEDEYKWYLDMQEEQ